MQLNNIIFPNPKPSYRADSKNLIWISGSEAKIQKERIFEKKIQQFKIKAKIISRNSIYKENLNTNDTQTTIQKQKAIPCLWLPFKDGSDKVLIYFHGNAEDLGYSYDFTDNLRKALQINVLAVEYPGYGAYQGNPSASQILEDSETVFDFLTDTIGVAIENIFLFGRSIGSGPATHLAAKRKVGALMLMCPYTSIRRVVKDLAGSMAQYLIADRFQNIEKISKVKSPTFFSHGKLDQLIPYSHSVDLMNQCSGITYLNLSEKMTHNDFHMTLDIILPIKTFLRKCEIELTKNNNDKILIQPQMYRCPQDYEIFQQ